MWFRQTPKLLVLYLASSSPFSSGLATASPLQSSFSSLTPTNFMFSSTTTIQSPLWSSTPPAACQVSLSIPLLIYLLSLLCTSCTWKPSQSGLSGLILTTSNKLRPGHCQREAEYLNLCYFQLCLLSLPLYAVLGFFWLNSTQVKRRTLPLTTSVSFTSPLHESRTK